MDLKLPKVVRIYLGGFFGVIAGLLLAVAGCYTSGQILAIKAVAAIIAFAVSWIVLVAACYAYRLFRADSR